MQINVIFLCLGNIKHKNKYCFILENKFQGASHIEGREREGHSALQI